MRRTPDDPPGLSQVKHDGAQGQRTMCHLAILSKKSRCPAGCVFVDIQATRQRETSVVGWSRAEGQTSESDANKRVQTGHGIMTGEVVSVVVSVIYLPNRCSMYFPDYSTPISAHPRRSPQSQDLDPCLSILSHWLLCAIGPPSSSLQHRPRLRISSSADLPGRVS